MAAVASKESAKGMETYFNENYKDAIRHFTEAIKHEPKKAIHYVYRSFTYCQQREYSSALKDAKKAVNMNPRGSSMAYRCLGEAYVGLKRYHDALSAIKKGLKVDPNNINLNFQLAYAQFELDDVEEDSDSEDSSEDSDSEGYEDDEEGEEEQEENLDAATVKELISQQNALIAKQNRILELLESSHPLKVVDDVKAALGVLNRMVDDGGLIAKGSDLWCVATDLIEDAAKREVFICMPDDDGRIAWLKHNNNNKITKKNNITDQDLIINNVGTTSCGGAPEEKKEEPKEESDEDDDTGFCLISTSI